MKKLLTIFALGTSLLLYSCNDGSKESDSGSQSADGGSSDPKTAVEDSAEELATDFEKFMGKMTSAIKEVNEGAEAEKVTGQIDEWKMEAQKLSARMKTIVEEDFDGSKEAFEKKMAELSESEMGETTKQFSQEMMKLGQAGEEKGMELMKEIQSVMSELD